MSRRTHLFHSSFGRLLNVDFFYFVLFQSQPPPPFNYILQVEYYILPIIIMSSSSPARRPARDPAAPKRNMSAYLLYQNAMRDTFKQQNPGMTFGQLSKYTSAMYAEMPPAEKEAWNQRAEADKARYLHELSTYVPPPGYDVKGDAIATQVPTIPPKPRVNRGTIKIPRDPNAPKRNMSAYLLYQNCMRETFKNMNPGMTFGQLAKFTSHMYKSLPAEDKQRWDAHAAQDKARYEAEMASYVPPVS